MKSGEYYSAGTLLSVAAVWQHVRTGWET